MRRALALAALFACTAQSADTPSPNQIFERARAAASARTLPPFLAYTTNAAFDRKGKTKTERLRVILRTADGKAFVTPLAESAKDRIDTTPYVAAKPPYSWPSSTFGLAKPRALEAPSIYESPGTPVPVPNASIEPRVIGSVRAQSRDYDVTLVGTAMIGDARVYDLHLVPRFDPEHRRLRELFVDSTTYETRRIVMQAYLAKGFFKTRPLVTFDYQPFEGAWIISHASLSVTVRVTFFAYGGSGEFRLTDISAPTSEPDWQFDPTLLAAHRKGADGTAPGR